MPRKPATASKPAEPKPLPAALVKVEVKGQHLLQPLAQAVSELDIKTDEDYQAADELLTGIVRARRQWKEDPGMYGTAAVPGAIPKLKSSLDDLYGLNRRIDRPMEVLETEVRQAMRQFHLDKAAAEAEEAPAKEVEVAQVTAKLQQVSEQELGARTGKLKARLASQREDLEERLTELQAPAAPPVATHSAPRKVKKWRMVDKAAAMRAVVHGKIPAEVVTFDTGKIDREYRADVASWPGFEEYEDVIIAHRG